jgi:major intracellular serine protease
VDQPAYTSVNVCFPPEQPEHAVSGIVDTLFLNDRYRGFLRSIGIDPDRPDRLHVLTRFKGMAPPAGVAVLNDPIDVLSVPAPLEDSIDTVRVPIANAVPEGTQFLSTVPCVISEGERAEKPPKSTPFDKGRAPEGVALLRTLDVWKKGYFGQNIGVAIVDTGVGPHTNLPRATDGQSFVPGTGTNYCDVDGHGTHVAGTVLARGLDGSVFGVAPAASLYVARAATRHNDKCHDEWVAAAIVWAATRVRVMNVSLGCVDYSEPLYRAVSYAFNQDVMICAAAGDGFLNPGVFWPAAHPGATAVAASTVNDRRCYITALGDEIDIWAPGCPVESVDLKGDTIARSGTSGSAPHVAGVVALLLSRQDNVTLATIRTALAKTACKVDFDNRGRVSAAAALY